MGQEDTKIDVLIVDDSALMRKMISDFLFSHPSINPKATALNGRFALDRLKKDKFDVILLDLEMPEVDGISFLEEFAKNGIDIPVIILSSFAKKGAEITMKALSLGAKDFITKPSGPISTDLGKVKNQIIEKTLIWGTYKKRKSSNFEVLPTLEKVEVKAEILEFSNPPIYEIATKKSINPKLLVIGVSTGGPAALRTLLFNLGDNFPIGIVIAQHMPEFFTKEFANSLDNFLHHFDVVEASSFDEVKKGRILIAPGGRHIKVSSQPDGKVFVEIISAEKYNSPFRPSVDLLFESTASGVGKDVIGIIMTGMGSDGSRGLKKLHDVGAITIAQDELSCVIFSMPKNAIKVGAVDFVWSLGEISENLKMLLRYLGTK